MKNLKESVHKQQKGVSRCSKIGKIVSTGYSKLTCRWNVIRRWKVFRLLQAIERKGDLELLSKYRSFHMLDRVAKMLEKVMRARPAEAICTIGEEFPREFGFRSERATLDIAMEVVDTILLARRKP